MFLGDNFTLICGVQIKCQGEDAVDEVYWDEEITIPICDSCKDYLTQEANPDTLVE
jgi:hypothetical protein